MNYSKVLKELRNKLLLSQTELADLLEVSYASVNRWENKHCEPTIKAKRRIRDLLEKTSKVAKHD